jgi:hypothetical protein
MGLPPAKLESRLGLFLGCQWPWLALTRVVAPDLPFAGRDGGAAHERRESDWLPQARIGEG